MGIGTLSADVRDTNGNSLAVIWTVDGAPYKTNEIASGGVITSSNLSLVVQFGLGEHFVTVSASNGKTNPAICSMVVTVRDTIPPQILHIEAAPNLLLPPDHRMIPIGIVVDAVDGCDVSPAVRIVEVTSNEPQN